MSDIELNEALVTVLSHGLTICTKDNFERQHKRVRHGYYLRILDFGHYNGYKYLIYDDDPHHKKDDVDYLSGGNNLNDLIITVAGKINRNRPSLNPRVIR